MSRRGGDGGSLVTQATQAVRDHIRAHDLKVGDTLPGEAHFAEAVGVSRAVMREAFGALAALRLIDVGNGRRARVSAIDGSVIAASLDHAVATAQVSVPEIWDVRRTLELRTAALAATKRTDAEAEAIMGLARSLMASDGDLAAITRHDIAFHEAIARASHNALFVQIISSFAPMMEVAVPAAWRTRTAEAQREAMLEQHARVAQAIVDRDAEAALLAMTGHFDQSIGHQLADKSLSAHLPTAY
jgi:GntR family transcriptional regulator, transcriptional repressor for pyruvate dehydrogenase complex